jgi:hypothetical protein
VRKVLLKRTPNGTALVKAILKGNVGTQDLSVVPPNPGDEGGIILAINGGGTYCASFGGAAGGGETADSCGRSNQTRTETPAWWILSRRHGLRAV